MPRNPSALILALALAGCAGRVATKPTVPHVVYVPVVKTVPVPAELTKPCPPKRVQERTVEQVVNAYNANVPVQDDCDKRMREIRELPTSEAASPKAKPATGGAGG
ncbi:hypothetical protein QY702_04450 [Xanthomonas campestris pv. plantaginis]|uniref:Rz1-like lysis system protein LysC n=1 Tax=Xanthomonas campestris TaxID=339 RepID=UPI002B228671|nr:hypothetical protein [Xanthomonas campestris]MEA9605718.1 hypothetical protein [Xanthomonas campestris pv. plantaginis]